MEDRGLGAGTPQILYHLRVLGQEVATPMVLTGALNMHEGLKRLAETCQGPVVLVVVSVFGGLQEGASGGRQAPKERIALAWLEGRGSRTYLCGQGWLQG